MFCFSNVNWQLTKCTEKLQNGITTEYDYQYDKDGNRSKYVKTVNGEWTECYTYEYNAANQLVKRTNERLWADNVTHYTYDANGNLISEQTGLFEKTYEYTAENRLAVVKAQGTVLMAALYDGDGNRLFTMDYMGENNDRWDIWIPECGGNADQVDDSAKDAMKELAGLVSWRDRRDYTITEYVNDVTRENEEVLAELNHRGKVTTAYTYGYSRESADVYGDTQYYLYDGQSNVSRISSEWGRVKETYNYDPYGNLTYGIPDTVNYYGYNGESSNLATGLQYLRARYYNPQTGSFITEDTYAGQISNPLTLNRYDYVSNNPVNFVDPSGHSAIGDFFTGLGEAFQRGWDIQQKNQQYEQQIMSDFYDKVKEDGKQALSDAWNKITTVNQQQQELEQKITQIQADIIIGGGTKFVEPIVEFVTESAKMNYTAQVQKQQVEEEAKQAFCEILEEHETELKFATGGLVITGTGAIAIVSHGVITQPFIGSIIGGIVGGFMHYALAEEGEDAMDEAADGFMWGTINGAACATVGQFLGILGESLTALQNPLVLSYMEGLLETAVEEFMLILQGENLTVEGIGYDLLLNIFTSGENPRMKDLADSLEPVMKKLGDWFDDTAAKAKELVKKVFKQDFEENYILFNKTHKDALPKPKGTGPNGGRLQSHHALQQQWAIENLSQYGYTPDMAPTVTIETGKGMPHTTISNLQNARRDARVANGSGKWSSSLQEELSYIVSDFKAAGFSDSTIREVLEQQYNMLNKLGVSYERIEF